MYGYLAGIHSSKYRAAPGESSLTDMNALQQVTSIVSISIVIFFKFLFLFLILLVLFVSLFIV